MDEVKIGKGWNEICGMEYWVNPETLHLTPICPPLVTPGVEGECSNHSAQAEIRASEQNLSDFSRSI